MWQLNLSSGKAAVRGKRTFRPALLLLLAAVPLLVSVQPAQATDYTVNRFTDTNDGVCGILGFCSLRDAVMAANANPGPDRILLESGTYVLTIDSSNLNDDSTADLDIIDAVEIIGVEGTVIDAQALSSGSTARSFTIGSQAFTGTVKLSDLSILGGSADTGAGINALCGNLDFDNLELRNNFAPVGGGGLVVIATACDVNVEVSRSSFSNNAASGGCGGGLLVFEGSNAEVNVLIEDTTFHSNTAASGGALCVPKNFGIFQNDSPTIVVKRSTFESNFALSLGFDTGYGGAVYLEATSASPPVFENTTFSDNSTSEDSGRGIPNNSGGAIALRDGAKATLIHATIANNSSTGLNGGDGVSSDSFSQFTFVNTLIANNACRIDGRDDPIHSGSLESPGTSCMFTGSGSLEGVAVDALNLEPLAKNGGLTRTHAIPDSLANPSSPLLSAAQDTADQSRCLVLDQRGVEREFSSCDIGAFETPFCVDPNVAIPNNAPGISSSRTFSGLPAHADLDVYLKISHDYVGDLVVTLQHSATNTTVTLLDRPGTSVIAGGCPSNDVDLFFDDEATADAENCLIQNQLQSLPEARYALSELASFDGKSLNGTWTLDVSDNGVHKDANIGSLVRWCLAPTFGIFVDGFETGDTTLWTSSTP